MSRRLLPSSSADLVSLAAAAGAGAAAGFAAAGLSSRVGGAPGLYGLRTQPNRQTTLPQLDGSPPRRYYSGRNLKRAVAIADLRAMTHRRLPTFALEYLEGGAEDEETLARERAAYADWRFRPRTLVDVSHRTLETEILGRHASMPVFVGPTGLNGIFRRRADTLLAQGAARSGVPFAQSTMSNDAMEEVAAAAPGLRHFWQLYVFGDDEVWRALLKRADRAGCEGLILTTNTQIFGNREWQTRTQATSDRLSIPSALEVLLHPEWWPTLAEGAPSFANVLPFIPEDQRSFFKSSSWIRSHQPTSMSWDTVARIREAWKKPFILKGLLNLEDVERARSSGVDGIVLGAHGGRQLDWCVSALDLLPEARRILGPDISLFATGGVRRGTDLLKALALGADAVFLGRAPLYGVCAAGEAGVRRALEILKTEALDAMGLLGVSSVKELTPDLLARSRDLPPPPPGPSPAEEGRV